MDLTKEEIIKKLNDKEISFGDLTDMGICPTCFDRENNNVVYGDNSRNVIYKDDDVEIFLVGNPRSNGHTCISSIEHFKDMMEIPDQLCKKVFLISKRMMNIIKDVYESESVYLCTMCDGPMNHFHVQLIPRYKEEKRGSKNFVKERKEYIYDEDKIEELRKKIKEVC